MSFKTRNGLPMRVLVLNHLRKHGNLSPIEASAMWACRDLPKRISELKKAGHPITVEYKRDDMGQRYARYTYDTAAARKEQQDTREALAWILA